MTPEPAAVLKTLRAQIEEVATQLMQRLDGLGFTLTRELWLKDAPLEIADAFEKFVATYAAAQRQAVTFEYERAEGLKEAAELFQRQYREALQERDHSRGLVNGLRAQLAAVEGERDRARNEILDWMEAAQAESPEVLKAQLTASEATRAQARQAIENEEEMDGEMPDDLWLCCRTREGAAEVIRAAVRVTKANILATLTPGAAAPGA